MKKSSLRSDRSPFSLLCPHFFLTSPQVSTVDKVDKVDVEDILLLTKGVGIAKNGAHEYMGADMEPDS